MGRLFERDYGVRGGGFETNTPLHPTVRRDNFASMNSGLTLTTAPELKRPTLHKLIDELPAEEIDLVEHVLARLEMDRLWQQVRAGFTQDWVDGKYARLDELIQEVRAELNQRAA